MSHPSDSNSTNNSTNNRTNDRTKSRTETPDTPDAPEALAHFRQTLVRVMSVQVGALLLLWWLQSRYAY